MKKILSVIIAIVIIMSSATLVLSDDAFKVISPTEIRVGICADFEPFEYYDENGNLTGFDIDLMNYIGERSGLQIEFVNMEFDAMMNSVLNGEVDCAISAITVTEERSNYFDYTVPYLSANVTYSYGENSDTGIEEYAIVFPDASVEKMKVLESSGIIETSIYYLVNSALIDLIEDKTVEKLAEKYGFNKIDNADGFDYEYTAYFGSDNASASNNDKNESASSLSPPSDWALNDIEKAEALNITEKDKIYRYNMSITREEFCELIYNYCYNIAKKVDVVTGENKFTDTTNSNIIRLNKMGIINGKSETEFAPDDLLTREEAATILNRMINVLYPDLVNTELYFEFADADEISKWAMTDIQRICNIGIMKGVGENKFAPQKHYTTEQAIVTIVRIFANSGTSKNDVDSDKELPFADRLNAQMPLDKNYMFSPISIKMALALAANGASGKTQAEILNALGISNLDDFNALSEELIKRYSQTDVLRLNIANSIWINKDKTSQNFSEDFKNTANGFYDADVKSVNNSNAVEEINSWVSEKTNKKIPKIVESADDFWAMIVNAIYFRGLWDSEFSEAATKPDIFNNADGTQKTIDFMNKTRWFSYAESESAKILEMPYKNRFDMVSESGEFIGRKTYDDLDVSMYLVLPDGDIDVEKVLSSAINNEKFKTTYVKMSMPKFKIEYQTNLNKMLMDMGIRTAFDEHNADFKNMFDMGNMWFTNTLHKTYISVDEKGTEAAAVTALHMAGSALPPKPIELKFDKPFYFAIRDNISGETLFLGRYAFAN